LPAKWSSSGFVLWSLVENGLRLSKVRCKADLAYKMETIDNEKITDNKEILSRCIVLITKTQNR
jgi:hypothetical protein